MLSAIAMVISGIVMATIYSAYTSQTRAYQIQDEVSVVQQNLRAAAYYMEREIRMAGYDPFETVLGAVIRSGGAVAPGLNGPETVPKKERSEAVKWALHLVERIGTENNTLKADALKAGDSYFEYVTFVQEKAEDHGFDDARGWKHARAARIPQH